MALNPFKDMKKLILYWIVSVAVIFLGLFLMGMGNITSDGQNFVQRDCIAGWEDKRNGDGECYEYGEPYLIPLGEKMKDYLLWSAIFGLFGVMVLHGWFEGKKVEDDERATRRRLGLES